MECPRCNNPMEKSAPIVSGNSKYESWTCDVCDHTELKATTVLK